MSSRRLLPAIDKPPAYRYPCRTAEEILSRIHKECGPIREEIHCRGEHTVILLPKAVKDMDHYFETGDCTPHNCLEGKMRLAVRHFADKQGRHTWVVVRCYPLYLAERTPTFCSVAGRGEDDGILGRIRKEVQWHNRNALKHNVDRYGYLRDPFLRELGDIEDNGDDIHSHPGISVRFSAIDLADNQSTSDHPQIHMIIDPINVKYNAMMGVNAEPVRIIFCRSFCDASKTQDDFTDFLATGSRLFRRKGSRSSFRMYFDSQKNAHIKMHARFRRGSDEAALIEAFLT